MGVKFEGVLSREGKWYAVGVPALEVWSQGKNRADAFRMIREAVELSMERSIEVEVLPMAGNRFVLRAKDSQNDRYLVAMMLKNHRAKSGLSLSQVADRLKIARSTYAQYEQARSLPSVGKIETYISAMGGCDHVVLDVVSGDRRRLTKKAAGKKKGLRAA